MTMDDEDEMPGTGAVCTFGKSKFAGNLPGMFWVKGDPVIQIACGDEHSVFVTASGRVFSFGSNEYGQLGHGHKRNLARPKCIRALKNQRAIVVACGRAHTLVATDDQKVYGFGMNAEHQLGLGSKEEQHADPVALEPLGGLHIKQLAAGAEHSVALTEKGTAYVWGGGKEGQLGLGSKSSAPVPLELKVDIKIMCISAGYYHTAIVSVDGILYTFGERDGGKLGLPKSLCCKRYNKPTEVSSIPGKVVSVSCGGTHTLALTADGKTYAFGDGRNGQLGLGSKSLQTSKPQPVTLPEGDRIAKVECGESHSAFLSERRQLYTCGDGRHGKLALASEETSANQFTPALVDQLLFYQVQQVACGGCHTLVLVVPGSDETNGFHSATGAGEVNLARIKKRHRKTTLVENDSEDSDGCEEDLKVTAKVLSETGSKRRAKPLLQEAETDTSIRHVDSDVSDDDASEMSVLNKTQVIEHIGSKEILAALDSDEVVAPKREGGVKESVVQNGDRSKAKLNGPKEDTADKVGEAPDTPRKKEAAEVPEAPSEATKKRAERAEAETPKKKMVHVLETPKKKLSEKPLDSSDPDEKAEEASKLISSEADTPKKKGVSPGGKRLKKKKKGTEVEKDGVKGEGDNRDAETEPKSSACSVM